jgi:hypothetical protein
MEEEAPTRDVEYLGGLCEAVNRGVEFGMTLLETEQGRPPRFPIALFAQARLAARQKIPLELVIRRYVAARDLLNDFVLEESAAIDGQNHALRAALAGQGAAFDQLLELVTAEYGREEQDSADPGGARRLQTVQRLLAGERIDSSSLSYPLDHHHVGVIAGSPEAQQVIRRLATATDTRLLIVGAPHGEIWAWLGSATPLERGFMQRVAASVCSNSAPIGLGAPAREARGWRLTHRQARLAFGLAQARQGPVHYADAPLVASAAQDPQLRTSLQELYLLPLTQERDGGKRLRKTLRAYFSANRNGESAGAALGVTRQTVKNHLCQVEDRLGQPLSMCGDAVDVALRLEELGFLEQEVDDL